MKIKNIPLGELHPHPQNPRKDLGDISELAESIKHSGIMQNLTVVKRDEGGYTVIIGHRRCAAAKIAGLESAPCAVCEMSEKEQVQTMMVENLHRSDLTFVEQAEGFQMMFDMGSTMDEVVKETGFSESTVRRRIKLLEFDKDKLVAAEGRGATLDDYAKIYEIKDENKRNRALAAVGTSNFDYTIQSIKDEEKKIKKYEEFINYVSSFAKELKESEITEKHSYIKTIYSVSDAKSIECEGREKGDWVFTVAGSLHYPYIRLYRPFSDEEVENRARAEEERAEEEEREQEKREARYAVEETCYELRKSFIEDFNNKKFNRDVLILFLFKAFKENCYIDDDTEEMLEAEDFEAQFAENPTGFITKAIYRQFGDGKRNSYFDHFGKYVENEELDVLYDFLLALGYQMSDAEKQLKDGSHELYEEET